MESLLSFGVDTSERDILEVLITVSPDSFSASAASASFCV